MSYSTRTEVRDMVKDDALNAIIGDTFIEDPAEREELVSPIIDAAIADADAEIDATSPRGTPSLLAPAPEGPSTSSPRISRSTICSPASASTRGRIRRPT